MPRAWVRGAVGVLITFGIVEVLTQAEFVNPAYLPPLSSVAGEAAGLLDNSEFWDALGSTTWAAAYGLARAILIAVPLGIVLGLSKWAYRGAMTAVEILRPLPSVALIPLAILQFGTGTSMKAFLATYACLWPLLFNTVYGMRGTDQVGVDTARAFGLGPVKTAIRVNLRAASPFIYTGIKIAASVALILVIGAEVVAGGPSGLGIEMRTARESGDLTLAYAYTFITGVIGIVLYIVLEVVERWLFAWNRVREAGDR